MFRKPKIFPTNATANKEKLDTVPKPEVIEAEVVAENQMKAMIHHGVTPITFFDMNDDHAGYGFSTIMSLPLEIQGIDNYNVARNEHLLEALTDNDLSLLHWINTDIQTQNIFGILVDIMYSNFQIFAYQAPSLNIFGPKFRTDIANEFGSAIYNNKNDCMDPLRDLLNSVFNKNIFSAAVIDKYTLEPKDVSQIDRSITFMNAISKQVNEVIAYIVCNFTNIYVNQCLASTSDRYIESLITLINTSYNLREDLSLNDRVTLRSFISETIREDLKIMLVNNMMPSVNHVCDNCFVTTYYIYKSILDDRNDERQNQK